MVVTEERIEQLKKMVERDPASELAQFSLGKALLDADRPAEASAALRRTIEINPHLSIAYQLLAESRIRVGNRAAAILALQRGYVVAQRHGDLMPAKTMARMLRSFGEAVPETRSDPPAAEPGSERTGFRCRRCGEGERMAEAPMRGELGQEILESICSACWREWLGVGTKIINELHLDFRDPEAQDVYDQHLKGFLGLEERSVPDGIEGS